MESKSDRVEVVRCKDCEYGCRWKSTPDRVSCRYFGMRDADWYCATGKRRSGITCNDCYLAMQNCHDISICCEDETGLCDFEPMKREEE